MSDVDTASEKAAFPGSMFGFAGRIGRAQYFVGIVAALVALVAAFAFAGAAMAPTGASGGAVLVGIPLIGLFVWILSAVTVQRLHDAGKHPALAFVFILGPILLLYPALELIEVTGGLMFGVFFAILVAPGFMGPKPKDHGPPPNT